MSATLEPYKWFWAYTSRKVGHTTYLADTYEEIIDHAVNHGEFDEIFGKDAFIAHEESILFEVREDELEEYTPIKFTKEKAA